MPELMIPKPAHEKLGTTEVVALGYNALKLARSNDLVLTGIYHYLGCVYHGQLTEEVLEQAKPVLAKAASKRYLGPKHSDNGDSDKNKLTHAHEVVNGVMTGMFQASNNADPFINHALVTESLLMGDINWLPSVRKQKVPDRAKNDPLYASQIIKYGLLDQHLKPTDFSNMFKLAAAQILEWESLKQQGEDVPYVFKCYMGHIAKAHLKANRDDKKDLKEIAPQIVPKRRFLFF